MEIFFFIGMALGQHCGYTNLTQMRGGMDQYQNKTRMIISTLTFPAWIGLFIWGFLNLTWYLTLGTFLFCAFLITPFIFKPHRLNSIFKYQFHTELSLIIIGLLIWFL